jgi:GNAT superfamily N-acetyltransferase
VTDFEIDWYDGPRSALRHLFQLAEDSDRQLDAYLELGRVLIARRGDGIIGHLLLVPTAEDGVIEAKNMAVVEAERGTGVGRALLQRALAAATTEGNRKIIVATGAADVGNLRFYQRCGFRMLSVERDAFTPETGYPEPILIDGIELRDRVWFSWEL